MLGQGTGANTQAMNAGGGGSNVQRSNQIFGENYASGAYQNAFNNFQQQRQNIYNTLAGIAGIGQTGQTATNQAGMTATTNIGNAGIGAASAIGAGQVGSANALAGGLTGASNGYTLSQLLNQNANYIPGYGTPSAAFTSQNTPGSSSFVGPTQG
jgi:hypothetical protein